MRNQIVLGDLTESDWGVGNKQMRAKKVVWRKGRCEGGLGKEMLR